MLRRILAALLVACCVTAVPAFAMVKKQAVKFRIADEAPALMRKGEPWSGTLEIRSPVGADIEDFEFQGEGWEVAPVRTGAERARLAAGDTVRVRLNILRANPDAPLTVTYISKGEQFEHRVNLRGLARPQKRVKPLNAMPLEEVLKMSPDVDASRFAKPGLPRDRRSRDAEGVERGAVGDLVIGAHEPAAALKAGAPNATAAKNIRVRGRLAYQFKSAGALLGADGVMYQIYDEDSSWDELLAEGTTDVNGNYDVTFYWDPCLTCDSNPDIYVYFETENDQVVTQSPELEWEYSWETSRVNDYTGSDLNMGTYAPGDNESDGVLYAHTVITRQWRWFNDNGWNVPSVDVQCWDDDADPVSYYTSIGEIHLAAPRMFFSPSMMHEYGHHWMENFSSSPAPDYCNGTCDQSGDCGHCQWCQEKGVVVLTEGFVEFHERQLFDVFAAAYPALPLSIREYEPVDSCSTLTRVDDWTKTEGLFAAAVYDLVDTNNENDAVIPGPSADVLTLSRILPYTIMDQATPASSRAFFDNLLTRMPSQRNQIWSTAANGGTQLDAAAPLAVTGLSSTDHTVNVESPDGTIAIKWTAAFDDWSGIAGYSVSVTPSPILPDSVQDVPAVTNFIFPWQAPGTYYVNVRAKDIYGRWATTYATAGPYVIRAPEPADIAFPGMANWVAPVVPRNANNAVLVGVPAPTALAGNTANTWWNFAGQNVGEMAASQTTDIELVVDGDSLDLGYASTLAAGATFKDVNNGPVTVRGGRHTLGAFADADETMAEPDELNNEWARQWVWSPLTVAANTLVTRDAAPFKTGGWNAIPAGELKLNNVEGLRFSSTGWWTALWAYATDMDDDTDVRLHFPSASVDTGFGSAIASSARGKGLLDAVIVNRNTLGILNWDVGILNYDGGVSDYRAKLVTSLPSFVGDSANVNFASDEFIALRDVSVGAGVLGDVMVTVRAPAGSQPIQVQWMDRTFGYGGLSTYVQKATTDSAGFARFVVHVTTAAFYGVAVYRDPKDGTGAVPFTLQISRAPADLAVFTPPGWHSPLVPRPATDGTFASVPLPDTLHGNVWSTYFNMAGRNIGTIAAAPSTGWMEVDDAIITTFGYGNWIAGAQQLFNSTYAVNVRGGRHTLTYTHDATDVVEELVTTNNAWGEQYVWSPLSLVPGAPVSRTAPPDRMAGWADVSSGEANYYNVDGLRTAATAPAGHDHYWSAVASMPSASTDVDLRLHEISAGTKNGFRTPIASSVWGTGQSDYVLANFNSTAYRRFDVGAMRWAGDQSYTAEAVTSAFRTLDGNGRIGPFTQAANRMLDLHEVYLTQGSWGLELEPVSGTPDFGFSLHGGAALQGKSQALGAAWVQPGGSFETMIVNVPATGYYCVAVWKAGSADLAQAGSYRLRLTNQYLDAEPAAVTTLAFGAPYPNPSRGETAVEMALPAPGDASLEVFDITGARIRTLVRGAQPAGRQVIRWDGRTDAGARVPAGLYYMRFQGGGLAQNRKVVLVE